MMKKESNPFVTVGYVSPTLFCDRENEHKQLTEFMLSGINVTLFAIRRLGKTGLIQHVFYPFRDSKETICIYLDILSTSNLSDFTNQIATAVYNKFPVKNSLGKKISNLFHRFRPVISFDEFSGTPSLSITLETQAQKEQTIGNILQFLDQQDVKIVFAIDEFQQILEYPEKNTEAILRTYIQQLKNTSFIFCGSNQKMMHEIFNSAKRPFFASCTNMQLGFIEKEKYSTFIHQKFEQNNRKITQESIDFICDWTQLHTFFTQHLCFTLFAQNNKQNTIEETKKAAITLLKLNESNFYQYKNLLTESQWKLLCAIAKEEKVTQPYSKDFIAPHNLGTTAMVTRGLEALIKKEILFYNTSVENPYYEVYDKYLMRWIQNKMTK